MKMLIVYCFVSLVI